jgi:hypothetical protein
MLLLLIAGRQPAAAGSCWSLLGKEGPFPHPSGDGRQYTVKWAQDDEGRLFVLGCTQLQ